MRQLTSPVKEWSRVSVQFSRKGKVLSTLATLMIPTCIPELVVLGLIFPALVSYLLVPFLLLPIVIALITLPTIYLKGELSSCRISLKRNQVLITIPGKDFFVLKPRAIEPLGAAALVLSSRFNKVTLGFVSEDDRRNFLSGFR